MRSTSPTRHGTTTLSSSKTRAIMAIASQGISVPSPNTTLCPGRFKSSVHPRCAAKIWLKKRLRFLPGSFGSNSSRSTASITGP